MTDKSHLDNKYFIDRYVYNCPFCNRGNVSYHVEERQNFDWTNEKPCFIYIVKCLSCDKKSLHLTYQCIEIERFSDFMKDRFVVEEGEDIDSKFFYSVPTSFFTLDSRIPKVLRLLFVEAEGCLKSNYLTGASVCVRKVVYEMAALEHASGKNYDERIKSLKNIRTDVEPEYFDTLLMIQQLTSDKIHEESYDGWKSTHLKTLLITLGEILTLMYVIPELRKEKRAAISKIKEELTGEKRN